jgi:LysR family glycine cleavage system transcriptional activator
LIISAPPSVVSGWLSQRIGEFLDANGAIDISLRSDEDPVNIERNNIDVRMSYGRFHYRTHDTNAIIADAIFPVCASAFLKQNGPLTTAESLLRAPLIHTDWGPSSATFPTWRSWFEAASVSPGRQTDRGLVANSSNVAINLAVGGLGITLAQGLLIADLVKQGALVYAHDFSLPQSQPYCLTVSQRSAHRPIVVKFNKWLTAAFKATINP